MGVKFIDYKKLEILYSECNESEDRREMLESLYETPQVQAVFSEDATADFEYRIFPDIYPVIPDKKKTGTVKKVNWSRQCIRLNEHDEEWN